MKTKKLSHPPCWCVAPSLCPLEGQFFDALREQEDSLLARGIKVRIVLFDTPELILGVAYYDAHQSGPTNEQLVRIYRSSKDARTLMATEPKGLA